MRMKLVIIIMIILAIFQLYSDEDKRPIIAVMNLEATNTNYDVVRLYVDSIISTIIDMKEFRVIERNKLDQLLKEIELSVSEAFNESHQLQIGKLLSANWIIIGSVGQIGNKYTVNLKLIDIQTSEYINTVTAKYDDMNQLRDDVKVLILELLKTSIKLEDYNLLDKNNKIIAEFIGLFSDIIKKDNPVTFKMGSNIGAQDEIPIRSITLTQPFAMGKYQITNKLFALISNWAIDKGYARLLLGNLYDRKTNKLILGINNVNFGVQSGIEINGEYIKPRREYENHPVVGVTFYGAMAFCNYLNELLGYQIIYNMKAVSCDWTASGYRLPTEAEWEFAAKGITDFLYPWGNDIDGSYANYYLSGDPFESTIDPFTAKGGPTTPVGFYDGTIKNNFITKSNASPFKLYDMSGNVWEWTWTIYSNTNNINDNFNPKGPQVGSYRTVKGGFWGYGIQHLRISNRDRGIPDYSGFDIGFRLVLQK